MITPKPQTLLARSILSLVYFPVSSAAAASLGCEVASIFNQPTPQRFRILCETPPGNNAELQYVVMNLCSHINDN